MNQELVDVIVESFYAQAHEKKAVLVSEGGRPAEARWWDAIEQAYKQGVQDGLDGLHNP